MSDGWQALQQKDLEGGLRSLHSVSQSHNDNSPVASVRMGWNLNLLSQENVLPHPSCWQVEANNSVCIS